MKYLIYPLLLTFLLISCEENFSPKVESGGGYVFFCLVNADAELTKISAFAWITNIYDVDGLDPNKNTVNPNVSGANIILTQKNFEYKFSEFPNTDTSRYDSAGTFYRLSVNAPSNVHDISIKAVLPNGKTMTAKTSIPQNLTLEFSYIFASGITTKINQFLHGNSWVIDWSESPDDHYEHVFFPKIYINYYKQVSATKNYGRVEVPIKIIELDGNIVPVYPKYIYDNFISFDFAAFDWAMLQISGNDPNKSDYHIEKVVLSIDEFDLNLSKYYSSVNGYLDEFSIRIDESVYSNISGGIGIFGSYTSTLVDFEINKVYAESFGYQRY